jgi:hypothetical protein
MRIKLSKQLRAAEIFLNQLCSDLHARLLAPALAPSFAHLRAPHSV